MSRKHDCIGPLTRAGIDYDDALALRRIAMTLRRWYERECGDGNEYGSWAIERAGQAGDGAPYLVHHHYSHGRGLDHVSQMRIPDKEAGAKRRLGAIMAKYPQLGAYVQTDPRGAALYILRPGDVREGADVECCYSNGLAVY